MYGVWCVRCEVWCVRCGANPYLKGHKGVKTWTRKLKREQKTLFDLDRCVMFDV